MTVTMASCMSSFKSLFLLAIALCIEVAVKTDFMLHVSMMFLCRKSNPISTLALSRASKYLQCRT